MKRVAALRIRWMEERGKCEKQCALMEQRDSGERESHFSLQTAKKSYEVNNTSSSSVSRPCPFN